MNQSALTNNLEETRRPLHQARHVPGHIYTSPEILALEKEHIFLRDWLCVARVEEIANPGDYMTLRILEEPVLLTRSADGAIHAMANVCRHRGVEIAAGSGNLKEFSCPYHGWTYGLDGQLIGAPYMKEAEGFDPKTCRLAPLRSDVWAGWVFINFDPDAKPLADFVADFDQDFARLHQERCRFAAKIPLELDCNWKLTVENLMDAYHFQVLHAATFGNYVGTEDKQDNLGDRYPFNMRKNGGFSAFYNAYAMTPEGKSLFGPMPWMPQDTDIFGCIGYLAPNMHMFARCDNVHPFVIWPLGESRSQVMVYSLFPEEFFDQPDFAEKAEKYHGVLEQVVEEDRAMVRSLQINLATDHFRPGRMSKLERPVYHFLNYTLDRILGGC